MLYNQIQQERNKGGNSNMIGMGGVRLILAGAIVLIIVGLILIAIGVRKGAQMEDSMVVEMDIRKILGGLALIFLFILLLTWAGNSSSGRTPETWMQEVKVVDKTTVSRENEDGGSEEVYIFICEDKDGIEQRYEITEDSLEGKFDVEDVFTQIQVTRYYRFTVGWQNTRYKGQEGYYPSVYGARKMEGFDTLEEPDWPEM